MSIPIVDRLKDAPEQGDCWLRESEPSGFYEHYRAVRDRKLSWRVVSVGGWNPRAMRHCSDPGEYTSQQISGIFSGAIFAPTAEAAIEQHLADREKCPFGRVTLRNRDKYYEFVSDDGWMLVTFSKDGSLQNGLTRTLPQRRAIVTLEREVIEFQSACAAGHPEQSAIGRWMKENGL